MLPRRKLFGIIRTRFVGGIGLIGLWLLTILFASGQISIFFGHPNQQQDAIVHRPVHYKPQMQPSLPGTANLSMLFEMLSRHRDLRVQVNEMYLSSKTALTGSHFHSSQFYDQYRMLFAKAEQFRDVIEPLTLAYTQNLSSVIFQRIYRNQFPDNCSTVKYAYCVLEKACGFGCQIHHAAHCLTVAFALGRTLLLNGKPWSYSKAGFDSVFHAITKPECYTFAEKAYTGNAETFTYWNPERRQQEANLLQIPIVDDLKVLPNFMPMGLPRVLAADLKALHSQPFAWWIGHFLRFILRPKPEICEYVRSMSDDWFQDSDKPLVGIHVRRTDKLESEAKLYKLKEYMTLVNEYYDQLEIKLSQPVMRTVYIATDDETVIYEAKQRYPAYQILGNPSIAVSAAVDTRYSDSSLQGLLVDLHFLARSDFLVCTFSSQICRLAFELMQTIHGDAGDRFRSLDNMYYYGGQQPHFFEAISPHVRQGADEISLQVGDLIQIAKNHWNGLSEGTNKRTGEHGNFPSYKVRDVIPEGDFAPFSNDERSSFTSPWYRLFPDSCLVVDAV